MMKIAGTSGWVDKRNPEERGNEEREKRSPSKNDRKPDLLCVCRYVCMQARARSRACMVRSDFISLSLLWIIIFSGLSFLIRFPCRLRFFQNLLGSVYVSLCVYGIWYILSIYIFSYNVNLVSFGGAGME